MARYKFYIVLYCIVTEVTAAVASGKMMPPSVAEAVLMLIHLLRVLRWSVLLVRDIHTSCIFILAKKTKTIVL